MVEGLIAIKNETILDALTAVTDPEIPVLSIMDMGIIRDASITDEKVHIKITPTYTGCPAMDTCLLYTSPSPRDATLSRMPSSA